MELIQSLGLNWQLLLTQILNFGIVLFVLTKFVYKPVLKVIDERQAAAKRAASQIEDAKRLAEEAENQRKKRLREADAEAGQILESAKKQAEAMQQDIVSRAKQEADSLMERGKQAVAAERTKALAEVQETVAKVVLQLTESLLRREFSTDDQKRMMKDLSEKLPALMA